MSLPDAIKPTSWQIAMLMMWPSLGGRVPPFSLSVRPSVRPSIAFELCTGHQRAVETSLGGPRHMSNWKSKFEVKKKMETKT